MFIVGFGNVWDWGGGKYKYTLMEFQLLLSVCVSWNNLLYPQILTATAIHTSATSVRGTTWKLVYLNPGCYGRMHTDKFIGVLYTYYINTVREFHGLNTRVFYNSTTLTFGRKQRFLFPPHAWCLYVRAWSISAFTF